MFYLEGCMFLTPLRLDSDMCCQIYYWCPAPGYCKQIGSYLNCFLCFEILYDNILQSAFCIGAGIKSGRPEVYRNSHHPRFFDIWTLSAGPCIKYALHLYSLTVKPNRIPVSLVVNSDNNYSMEYLYPMNSNIGRCGMGEHDAGSVVICED